MDGLREKFRTELSRRVRLGELTSEFPSYAMFIWRDADKLLASARLCSSRLIMTDIVGLDGRGRLGSGHVGAARFVTASQRFLGKFFKGRSSSGLSYDPYNDEIRKDLAEQLFRPHRDHPASGTVERGRLILDIIQDTFPTEALSSAYFENLDYSLSTKSVRRTPGKIVIGIGSGRNGSTSLAGMLSTIEGSCCTHENPPLMRWTPHPDEIRFHVKRLQRLARYFPVVVDVAHWWLNAIPKLFSYFPDALVIGVTRDVESCARSFHKIKGSGIGSCNHWVPYGNGIWSAQRWDPTYPTYAVPDQALENPDGAKLQLVTRYVREYNAAVHALAARRPAKFLALKTEDLSGPTAQRALYDFIGVNGAIKTVRLNVGTTNDGRRFRERHLV
jgi:Sulfotransferase domain